MIGGWAHRTGRNLRAASIARRPLYDAPLFYLDICTDPLIFIQPKKHYYA